LPADEKFAIRVLSVIDAREFSSNYLLLGGLLLLVLGIGNWVAGAMESARYRRLLHRTAQTGLEENYRIFQHLDVQKNEEVLRRITEDRERYNAARVKLEFFNVVLNGGKLFCFIGAILLSLGFLRWMRAQERGSSFGWRR
jgi:uncharacterized membrane protein YidH (DUF202 family)